MTNLKKQLKLTKMFRNGTTAVPDDMDQLQEEVRQLEQKLREKQNELFQIQRNSYRQKAFVPKKKTTPQTPPTFVRPQKIVLSNSVDALQRDIEMMSMLTGTEIQSFKANDQCCVVFHMQHDSEHEVKHGLRIDMKGGENSVSASSLPLGFKLSAVMEDFDNIMKPDCLGAIRKALLAYYDRLEQFEALKKLVNGEAQLFKTLDGSHMEISIYVQSDAEEDEQFKVDIVLDYRVYDIRPKNYYIKELDLPYDGAAEALREQCALFKKKPLHVAVKEAFIDSIGPYKLVQQIGTRPVQQQRRRKKRFRPNKHQYNDDTFLPEDCSDQSEDDEY